jgi:hypothetical protein
MLIGGGEPDAELESISMSSMSFVAFALRFAFDVGALGALPPVNRFMPCYVLTIVRDKSTCFVGHRSAGY